MQPFAIHCTTCKARLRVQDESAIGQILACPKCHSMVLIERPATHLSDTGATTDVMRSVKAAVQPMPTTTRPTVQPPPLPVKTVAVAEALPLPTSAPAIKPAKRVPRDWWLLGGGITAGAILGAMVWMLVVPRHEVAPSPQVAKNEN